ncbi:hypothetical protein [Massilia eburnea]|uniref:hypothetical protein n=1 Tax=Massilia eburnea TaxID=1776165 RepID=UPI003D6A0EAB
MSSAAVFALVGTVATPDLFIAFSKSAPDSREMLARFNQGYDKLLNSPRYIADRGALVQMTPARSPRACCALSSAAISSSRWW